MEQVEFTRPRYGLKLGDDLAMVSLAIDGAGGERITRVESILDPWTKILVSLQVSRRRLFITISYLTCGNLDFHQQGPDNLLADY